MIRYEHLMGKEFVFGRQDCYTTIQDFYLDNYGIQLPNYARPDQFWEHGMDMYMDRFQKNGFEVIQCHPADYRVGDVFLMSIDAPVVNHAGILIGQGKMLHHAVRQISTVTRYGGLWRNNTMAIVRHRVVAPMQSTEVDILNLVPENIRRKIHDHISQDAPAAS